MASEDSESFDEGGIRWLQWTEVRRLGHYLIEARRLGDKHYAKILAELREDLGQEYYDKHLKWTETAEITHELE